MRKSQKQKTYEVEKIVGKRVLESGLQYCVKWVGYPSYSNTWEPIENLATASDAIREFEKKDERKEHRRGPSAFKKVVTPPKQVQALRETQAPNQIGIYKEVAIPEVQTRRTPRIILKTTSEPTTHWVYGSRLKRIIKKEGQNSCLVEWEDETQSVEHLAKISWYEPEKLSQFLKRDTHRVDTIVPAEKIKKEPSPL